MESRVPRERIRESDRQDVLDAAAVLQVRRSEVATALATGRDVEAEVIATYGRGSGQLPLQRSEDWTEVVSVRPSVTADLLRRSLPETRTWFSRMRMVSVYDADGITPEARLLLADEAVGTYLISAAPVQMKLLNRTHVMLQGPTLDERATVMIVHAQPCLDAAWRYWQAVRAAAFPVAESVSPRGDLTPRQRQVFVLMGTGIGDDAIATSLGVSVRTVRSDVADVLRDLGVQSRYAAGVRLRLWPEDETT